MQNLKSSKEEVQARIRAVRDGIRITKITCTRSIKARTGDSFVGFSAAWHSTQDDHGGGLDLVEAQGNAEVDGTGSGMSLSHAKLVHLILSQECDVAALESAFANGSITSEYFQNVVQITKRNYSQLLFREMSGEEGSS